MTELTEALENTDCGCAPGINCDDRIVHDAASRWAALDTEEARGAVAQALKPYVDVDAAIEPDEWVIAQAYNARLAADAVLAVLKGSADV